jgi:3-dehydroquinate synthetase
VATSVRGKAGIVARDETETGDRMLLNLGHTFGHALEAWAGYSARLLHGEAVAIGICLAFELSRELGLVDAASVERVTRHLAAVGLPTRTADIPGTPGPDAATLMTIMAQDKKVRDGKLTFILVRSIGAAFISRDVPAATVHDFLAAMIRRVQ